MSELTAEKRAELRRLMLSRQAESSPVSITPTTVLSLLDALDAADATNLELKRELWRTSNRPYGYDVNGRTFSDWFGMCSHRVSLLRDCAECDAGSGRP